MGKMCAAIAVALGVLLAAGCGEDKSEAKGPAARPPTPVTVTKAEIRVIELTEESVGSVDNVFDPRVGAEIAGRVTRVLAEVGKPVRRGELLAEIDPVDLEIQARADAAEVSRLETLVANQERILANQQKLVEKNFISQNALDDSIAARNALREQLTAARAKLEANRNAQRKTRVIAPIDAEIEQRMVSPGDYVKVGDVMFRLVGKERLRARLPFPESTAPRLRLGQRVLISSPLMPDRVVEAKIDDIRPTVTATSRALDVIVGFDSAGTFRGGGTVNAQVIVGRKDDAIVVPEHAVVLRPAGTVVYLFEDGKAVQRIVKTGIRKGGHIEITQGLSGGETVVVDGAGFLTNNAVVAIARPGGAKAGMAKGGPAGKGEWAGKSGGAGKGDGTEKAGAAGKGEWAGKRGPGGAGAGSAGGGAPPKSGQGDPS